MAQFRSVLEGAEPTVALWANTPAQSFAWHNFQLAHAPIE